VNLFEQQQANRRRTWVVMGLFVLFLAILGSGLDLFILGGGEVYMPVATAVAVAIGGGQAWWSLRRGDQAVLKSTSAEPVEALISSATSEADRLRSVQFQNVVEEMAIAAGLPKPRAYVIPDDDPNALATGRDAAHATIAVTRGLLATLTREELQGVVAHEMAHIRNLDIRLMTVVAALLGAVLLLTDWTARSMRFGGGRRSSSRSKHGGGAGILFFVVWIVAIVLAPFIGQMLAMAVSRQREYLADATAAELTRNPFALATALERIDAVAAPTPSVKRGSAHLCIADPLGRRLDNREGAWADLWATHPPMHKRIEALRAMAFTTRP
jgi:heat shock protein HtpX